MTFGTKQFKNGKQRGYLSFSTGKKVILNNNELIEFNNKIEYWREYQLIKKTI